MRTSYSRRELYALGEPLGDSATYLKADGGYILGDGGGGGGSAPANTTSTSTQTAELPEWARGYAKDTLAKGAALTDINQNPYQQYTGDRIAGFSPMQQQAMQNAQGMSVAPQVGQGTAAATMAGLGGLGVAGQANPYGFQNQVGGYMNPYMNQILAPQLAEANRQYDIGATKQQSAATQAGAFGGSREAIMAAENERNRNTGLNQIIGQGYNTAFTNAQNQYNQNLQNQLAGFGMANQAAGQLGQLGQQQYQQGMGINQLQAQYGGQQQALQQQGLTQAYQDFQNQQNYPYKQLGFMSDMIRGLPLGQQSTKSVYEPPGSISGQIAGLGMGALGISQLGKLATAAEGGLMDSYAGGGEVQGYAGNGPSHVVDQDYLQSLVHKYPATAEGEQALLAELQRAQSTGNEAMVEAIQNELAFRKSMRSGVASAVTPQIAQDMEPVAAANGGIVAFDEGGTTSRFKEMLPNFLKGGNSQEYLDRNQAYKDLLEANKRGPGMFGQATKETIAASDAEIKAADDRLRGRKPKIETGENLGDPYNAANATRRADFEKPVASKPSAEVFKGLSEMSKATGMTMDSIVSQWKTLSSSINAENAEDLTQLNTLANKLSGRSNQIKQEGLGRALAEFGFKWAQSASRPGSRFIGSAAEAAPAISTSLAKTQEAMQAAEDNQQRIEIAMQQAKIASKQGNRALAAQLTQHANMLALQNKQIEQAGALGRAQIASIDKYRDTMAGVQANRSKAAMVAAEAKVIPLFQNSKGARDLAKQLESKYGKNWEQQSDPQIQYQNYFNKFKAMHLPSLIESGGGIPYSDAY
jgi:hypothetical protein